MRAAAAAHGGGNLFWHLRRTLTLAWPVMLARAGMLVMALVDSVMIGHVSGAGLAHYGVAMSPFLFFMLIGTGLLIGTVVLVAQADGAGDTTRVGVVWRLALGVAVVFGLLASLMLLPGEALLSVLGQPPELAREAGRVLVVLTIGLVPMLLFNATSLFLEGLALPRTGMLIMLAANVVNGLLNALFLYGPVELIDGAAAEAALATTVTRWLMAFAIIAYVLARLDGRALGLRGSMAGSRALLVKLVRLGLPIAGANGLESFAFTSMSMFAGWLGTLAAAAYLICLNFSALLYMLALGIGTAASVRVGNAVGRGDRPGIAAAGWAALGLGLAIAAIAAPSIIVFREQVAALYTSDPEVLARAVPALVVVAFLVVVDSGQGIMMGALRGAGDVRIPLAIQAVAYLGVAVPLGYWLAFGLELGVEGLVVGLIAGLGTAFVLLALRFHDGSRRTIRKV